MIGDGHGFYERMASAAVNTDNGNIDHTRSNPLCTLLQVMQTCGAPRVQLCEVILDGWNHASVHDFTLYRQVRSACRAIHLLGSPVH